MNADMYVDTLFKYAMKNREESITESTSLRGHLGMDNFQIMQVFLDLESQGVRIDYRKMDVIDTVRDLAGILN